MTKSGNIGAVLGTDMVPPVWRYGEGYKAGAKSINPTSSCRSSITATSDLGKTFNDPAWGKTTAISMIDKGADIVFGAGGNTGNGALLAAAERQGQGGLRIGVDTDQYDTVPEAQPVLLSSAMKLLTPGVFNLIQTAERRHVQGRQQLRGRRPGPLPRPGCQGVADVKEKMDKITAARRRDQDQRAPRQAGRQLNSGPWTVVHRVGASSRTPLRGLPVRQPLSTVHYPLSLSPQPGPQRSGGRRGGAAPRAGQQQWVPQRTAAQAIGDQPARPGLPRCCG